MNQKEVMKVYEETMHVFEKDYNEADVIVRTQIVRTGLFRALKRALNM